jgi:hypothetical protein
MGELDMGISARAASSLTMRIARSQTPAASILKNGYVTPCCTFASSFEVPRKTLWLILQSGHTVRCFGLSLDRQSHFTDC